MKKRFFTSMSKISAPKVSGTVERERLFRRLDKGREKPVIWVASPAGSGKTTLASGWLDSRGILSLWYQIDTGDGDPATFFMYFGFAVQKATTQKKRALPVLTPEYLQGIPVFTRRYFEDVFNRLGSSALIVLDNYQDAPADSLLHEILRCGVEAAPPGITFLVLSRSNPPPSFSRIRIAGQLHFIDWSDLRFSFDESKTMALCHGCALDNETLLALHQKANGWAAGLALLLRTREQWQIRAPSVRTPEILFDYFAEEIFLRTKNATRDFLMKTSFFPSMTVPMAEGVTGNDDAGAILNRLCAEHYFIESYSSDEIVYQYHPLFREFLRNSAANRYSRAETIGIQLLTAELLVGCGRFDDAGDILCEIGEREQLISLIQDHAQSMVEHGRLAALQRWLSFIPNDRLLREPWLCYWKGVCSHPFDLAGSESFFGEAFRLFRKQSAAREALMAWAGTVACIITEWRDFSKLDPWIEWLSEEADKALDSMTPEFQARIAGLMLICLTFRQPRHPRIDFYEAKAAALLDEPLEPGALLTISSHLMTHYTKMGFLEKARTVLDLVEPRIMRKKDHVFPEYLLWHTVKTSYFALSGAKLECLCECRKGLDLAASSGMHIYDIFMLFFGAMAGFIDEDHEVINEYLEQISAAKGGSGLILPIIYRQIIAWKCLLKEDYSQALEHVGAAMQQTLRLGSAIEHSNNRICYSRLLFELGKREEAGKLLAEEGSADYPGNSAYIAYMRLTTQAYFCYREEDASSGEDLLREALALGSHHRIMMHHYWSNRIGRCLCDKALELGIETGYARELAERHTIPFEPVGNVDVHQQATVMIRALGCFSILLHGEPLRFGRKAPKKPLELLKALIAFGCREVRKETLCDALWPDAEADRAGNAFKFTLHQLRGLLKSDTVLMKNGLLSLNSRYCWIDAQEFLHLCGEVIDLCRKTEHYTPKAGGRTIADLARQAIGLYGGDFLPSDDDLPWTASPRHRIREKMMRMLLTAGRHMESLSLWEEALFFHEKSVDMDDTNEQSYCSIMQCCAALGRIEPGIAAYHRCSSALLRTSGARPSPKTDGVYRSLLNG
jgi:DNA-binding SARP family transcriptional activator